MKFSQKKSLEDLEKPKIVPFSDLYKEGLQLKSEGENSKGVIPNEKLDNKLPLLSSNKENIDNNINTKSSNINKIDTKTTL